ncbi:unnamed protein product [Prorocentrum cordatum]|uniref:Uncharacterized protein n=1 Tax=Prorocentrum cordatum TaxID=2364126 RepID=A0ABN9Q1L0_9DINO|nr:unnamed protein product [Polarella glacialis]
MGIQRRKADPPVARRVPQGRQRRGRRGHHGDAQAGPRLGAKASGSWMSFTNRGFSIGPRFAEKTEPSSCMGRHDPNIGSMSVWDTESAFPTRQVCAQHLSSVAHTMGARRADPTAPRPPEAAPGPGTYEGRPGFAQELMQRLAKSPKSM